MRFHGSKALILFTRRLTPAELRLQSDRGTQKSEIYFTDYTLTGQPDGFASESQDCEWGRGVLLVEPSRGACQLYFTDYTLAGQPDAFPFPESGLRAGAGSGC